MSIWESIVDAAEQLVWWVRGRLSRVPPARLLSEGWKPRRRRVHVPSKCAMHSWCHDCDELPSPCCHECAAFGPCLDCLSKRVPGVCGYESCGVCGEGRR